MVVQMFSNLNNINLCIIGKPNSGKSTLFNNFVNKYISDVGDEYGLTKELIKDKFKFKNHYFTLFDTPGLRRKNKIYDINEEKRNREVTKLIKNVEFVILLIDANENITKQDFKLADLVLNKKKTISLVFNKIDLLDDKMEFIKRTKIFLKNNYSKYLTINLDFISAKNDINISKVLNSILKNKKLISSKISKTSLKKFLIYLDKKAKYPKIKNVEIRPKYIVQVKNQIPHFKIFINSKNKAPKIFSKFFENIFRDYFKLKGIPINFDFISSKNPYIN